MLPTVYDARSTLSQFLVFGELDTCQLEPLVFRLGGLSGVDDLLTLSDDLDLQVLLPVM